MLSIESGHFSAGVVLNERLFVKKTAPILKYMKNWHLTQVQSYCRRMNWSITEIDDENGQEWKSRHLSGRIHSGDGGGQDDGNRS